MRHIVQSKHGCERDGLRVRHIAIRRAVDQKRFGERPVARGAPGPTCAEGAPTFGGCR
jgi:hypothetical protein